MNEMKHYEVDGLRFEFSPNGAPLTGVLAAATEQAGPYVAELNLSKPRSRKSYAEEAGEVCGMDSAQLVCALNELCALRLAEVQQAREAAGEDREPKEQGEQKAPDGAEVLEELASFIRRYVALSEDQARLIALWTVHTHALDAADTTPYLNIKSAEPRSGKTRLLEVLSLLAARPWLTGRVTAAVLVRKTSAEQPALLLDESDAAFKGDREYAEALRGILNAGFRRGGVASLCVGQGANLSYEDFPVFGPKAIAGIGKLPDTVADRSVPVELRRRSPSEKVERFRLRKVEPKALPIRQAAAAWAEAHLNALSTAEPELPDELDDRAQDIIEPLLAIADAVGGEWPESARRAAVALLCGEEREDSESLGVRLLRDIRGIFDEKKADRLPTGKLLEALHAMEEAPWGSLRGEPLDARGLARLLKPYGVKPEQLRVDHDKVRGYRRAGFEDAWARYLSNPEPDPPTPGEGGTSGTSGTNTMHGGHKPHAYAEHTKAGDVPDSVPDTEHVPGTGDYPVRSKPHKQANVPDVPDVPDNPGAGEEEVSANGKGRRLTAEEAEEVKRLAREGMAPHLARADVLGYVEEELGL